MFLQRYNPWGKTKREQLQSWNILQFDLQKTDIDEHIDLINTLGNMIGQKDEAKMEKFIDTMPTIIQTHLVVCSDWDKTKDKAKELEHIIRKCEPLVAIVPTLPPGTAVPSLNSHMAQSEDKEDTEIPQPFKGVKPKQTKSKTRGKLKQQQPKQNPQEIHVQQDEYCYQVPSNYYHTENYRGESRGRKPYRGQTMS